MPTSTIGRVRPATLLKLINTSFRHQQQRPAVPLLQVVQKSSKGEVMEIPRRGHRRFRRQRPAAEKAIKSANNVSNKEKKTGRVLSFADGDPVSRSNSCRGLL